MPVTFGQEPGATPQEPVVQETTEDAAARLARLEKELADVRKEAAGLARLEKELADVRKEAAGYRTKLRAEEQAKTEAERKAAEEQGNFQKLYEQEQLSRAALEAQVAAATHRQAQLDAALAAGLPLDLAPRLTGGTPEELAADAAALAARFKPATTTPPATGATNPPASRAAQPPPFDPKNPPKLSSIEWKR